MHGPFEHYTDTAITPRSIPSPDPYAISLTLAFSLSLPHSLARTNQDTRTRTSQRADRSREHVSNRLSNQVKTHRAGTLIIGDHPLSCQQWTNLVVGHMLGSRDDRALRVVRPRKTALGLIRDYEPIGFVDGIYSKRIVFLCFYLELFAALVP